VNIDSFYYPPDIASLTNEWADGTKTGEPSGITVLDDIFKWMRGHQNGWYGWSGDGKGLMFDYLSVVKAKRDNWKFCFYKQEDMGSFKYADGSIRMTANPILNNLVWTLTGITPYKHIAARYNKPQLSLQQYHDSMEWVEKKFFVVYPQDRQYKNVKDNLLFMYEKFGIDVFLIDPFKALILPDGERGDRQMTNLFADTKEFALKTNTCFNFISHAKSMTEQKEKDGRYKVVNQFMQLGGSAWDISMDGQFSVYSPERHLEPNDPKRFLFNLKQRQGFELVGAMKGVYEKIKFDVFKHRFYFDGVDPIDGSLSPEKKKEQTIVDFTEPKNDREPKNISDSDMPF